MRIGGKIGNDRYKATSTKTRIETLYGFSQAGRGRKPMIWIQIILCSLVWITLYVLFAIGVVDIPPPADPVIRLKIAKKISNIGFFIHLHYIFSIFAHFRLEVRLQGNIH